MSDSERSDIEFAILAHQVHLPGWTRRQPTPQEWMISALRVLLGTAVTAAAMSAAAITFLIVAVFPLHGVNYLIEHQTVIDHRSASTVVRFWLYPSVLTASCAPRRRRSDFGHGRRSASSQQGQRRAPPFPPSPSALQCTLRELASSGRPPRLPRRSPWLWHPRPQP